MIQLEINGGFVREIEFTEGMTVSDVRSKLQSVDAGKHYVFNAFTMYDPSQNRSMTPTDEIVDGRYYVVSVWVQQVTDEQGNKLQNEGV
jgi:hypothetical protein